MSEQAFNKIIELGDNAEFIRDHQDLLSQNTSQLQWKRFPQVSPSGVGDGENTFRPLTSQEKLHTLLIKLTWFYSLSALGSVFTCSSSLSGSCVFPAVLRTITYCFIFNIVSFFI